MTDPLPVHSPSPIGPDAPVTQAQFQAQFQDLCQALRQQHAELAQLRQAIQALVHPVAVGSAVSSSTTDTPASTATLHKLLSRPSQFHGEHGNRVHDWLDELDICFLNVSETLSDAKKIAFARQCLRSEALRWLVAREQEVAHVQQQGSAANPGGVQPLTTWSAFKHALIEYFCPRGASEAARTELHSLRQSQFRSLAAYCDRFEAVSRRIEISHGQDIRDELITTFKHGLTNGQIRLHLTTTHPTSLFDAARLAIQAESDLDIAGVRTSKEYRTFQPRRYHQEAPHRESQHSYARPRHEPTVHFSRHEREVASTPMELGVVEVEDSVEEDESKASSEEPSPASASSRASSVEPEEEDLPQQPAHHLNALQKERARVPGKRPEKSNTRNRCWSCGQFGHFQADCSSGVTAEGQRAPRPVHEVKSKDISKKFTQRW